MRMPIKQDAVNLLDYDGFQKLPENSIQESVKDLIELKALRNIKYETEVIESGVESRSFLTHECSIIRETIAVYTG